MRVCEGVCLYACTERAFYCVLSRLVRGRGRRWRVLTYPAYYLCLNSTSRRKVCVCVCVCVMVEEGERTAVSNEKPPEGGEEREREHIYVQV